MNLWFWPGVYGAASTAGLLAALLGDGWLDAVSWLALSAPLVSIASACRRPRQESRQDRWS